MSVFASPKTFLHRLWYEPPPALGIEFGGEALAVARWAPGAGRMETLTTEALPEGALRPSPVRDNIAHVEEVRRAVAAALDRAGRRKGGKVALLLPDVAARVSVVNFEQFPAKTEEVSPLVRWRLKKSVPFEVDDAALAWQRLGPGPEGEELAVAVAPGAVVRQYESMVESLGYEPGFVTVSSVAALGLLDPADSRPTGTMLVRKAGRLLTIVVVTPGKLRVFRSHELPPGEETRPVEEIVSDVYGSSVYFEDNFHQKVDRVLLAGFGDVTAGLQEQIEQELGVRPQPLPIPGARSQDEDFLGLYGLVVEQARD